MQEIWKDIEGYYEFHYMISSKGRVVKLLSDGTMEFLSISEKSTVKLKTLMKAHSNIKIDKLVCKAFIPKIKGLNGDTVIHRDGDKENNCVENLEWSVPMNNRYLGEDNYKVYAHIAPNGKYYIGQTKQAMRDRWRNEGKGYKRCAVFSKAIKKYGWDNFEHIILEDNIKTQEEADEREQYYIKKFNSIVPNGYNIENGGVRGKNKNGKQVVCFNSKGELIKFFDSIYYASLFVNKDRSCISKAISEKIGCGGYYWCDLEDFTPEYVKDFLENYNGKVGRTIYQYDMNTHKLISTYNKVKDAANKTGTGRTDISSCLNGKHKTANGFIWSYEPVTDFSKYAWKTNAIIYDDFYIYKNNEIVGVYNNLLEVERELSISKYILHTIIEKKLIRYYNGYIISYRKLKKKEFEKVPKIKSKAVEQYTIEGEYIKTFRSAGDATVEVCGKSKSSTLNTAASNFNKGLTAYGYKWKYAEPIL